MPDVIISTSNLNCYGFRVLTEGIDIKQFKKNPIMLWMHNRPWRGTKEEVLPIGRIENLRYEDDKLIGTPVFDEKDEFAAKIKAKWDGGFLKMCSAGLDIIARSDDPKHIVKGQRYATVTKCKLREVSIVDMGANDDALALYNEGQLIELSAGNADVNLEFMKLINNNEGDTEGSPINNINMDKILLALGLAAGATEEQAVAKITELRSQADDAAKTKLAAVTSQVNLAIKDGKIKEEKREHYVSLGKQMGVEFLSETLAELNAPAKPNPASRPSTVLRDKTETTVAKKFDEMSADELETLRRDDPEGYCKLYTEYFGVEIKPNELEG